MKLSNPLKLIASIAFCQLAGIIGSLFTASNISVWYAQLNRPALAPPDFVFAPVWTVLFFLMGVSLYLVWSGECEEKTKKRALGVFTIQLLLNILWSFVFFASRALFAAFVEIVFLWLAVLWTIRKFYPVSHTASWLLVPYLLWVTFAAYLNFVFWQIN